MNLEQGARWEHFNGTTGEVRQYEVAGENKDRRSRLIAFKNIETGAYAFAWERTLSRPRDLDPSTSHWREVRSG